MAVKSRLNKKERVWYGEMRIPIDRIDTRAPQAGVEMRINFYRLQGPPPQRKGIAWQPWRSELLTLVRRAVARNFGFEVAQTSPMQPLIQINLGHDDRAPLFGLHQRLT